MAISHCYWHLVVNNGNFTLLLTSSGQWMAMAIAHIQVMAISYCYWHLVVKNWQFHIAYWHLVVKFGNFTLLLTSSGQDIGNGSQFTLAIWHLVVRYGNFTLLLTSSGQQWQFHHSYWYLVVWRMAISHCLLTSSGQEWQFHIATDI